MVSDLKEKGKQSKVKPSPSDPYSLEDEASFVSRWLLLYLNPLLSKDDGRPLLSFDLGLPARQDRCSVLHKYFEVHWTQDQQLPAAERSLWRVLWRTVGYAQISWALTLYSGYYITSFGPILILNRLVKHFSGEISITDVELWSLTALIFVFPALGALCSARSNVIMAHLGLQFRNVLVNAIHRKSLRLSSGAKLATSSGKIVNMFANDTVLVQKFIIFVNICVLCPPAIIVALALVYQQV